MSSDYIVKRISADVSCLGEGIFFCAKSNCLYWLDILNSKLFRYSLVDNTQNKIDLGHHPSVILAINDNELLYIDSIGVKSYDLLTNNCHTLCIHLEHNTEKFRANDGVILSNGDICYGTMGYEPQQKTGKIYYLQSFKNPIIMDFGIHIPNGFVEFENKLLITDSLSKIIYQFDTSECGLTNKTVWADMSDKSYTPDGGFISKSGFLHFALWDGYAVLVMDKQANIVNRIDLPIPRPTNCVLVDNRWLYVTSATEGLDNGVIQKYPYSGSTLVVDLGENYAF